MPPASTVCRTCSLTRFSPSQVNLLRRSAPLFQLPVQYARKTSGVLSQSGCMAIPSKPASLPFPPKTLMSKTVVYAPVAGSIRCTSPVRVVHHSMSSGPQRISQGMLIPVTKSYSTNVVSSSSHVVWPQDERQRKNIPIPRRISRALVGKGRERQGVMAKGCCGFNSMGRARQGRRYKMPCEEAQAGQQEVNLMPWTTGPVPRIQNRR